LPVVALGERYVGVYRRDAPQGREAALTSLLQGIQILPFGAAEARVFGQISAALLDGGLPLGPRGTVDLQIAATALVRGWPVVTLNRRDFERVPGLVVLGPTAP